MKIVYAVAFLATVWAKPFNEADECAGYKSCPATDFNKINVHLIPHSHDDVGWLKTRDQYYIDQVQNIITSVVAGLIQNPERRFIQVESAFFYMWWVEQPQNVQENVRQLVKEGRLEIINGAWSMNDEAAAHYQSTIDQFTYGLRFIEDALGVCARPKTGWQIDPFGHSREQASIFSQLGYDGFYFARLDYRDKNKRMAEKTMDLLWTGSQNLGVDSNIFTNVLYHHYSSPPNFCFDIRCNDPPVITDEDSPDYNWPDRVNEFTDFVKEQSEKYPTPNILITLGDDFRWEAALKSYLNYDNLIKGFDVFKPTIDGKQINIFYSTPSCYTKAVNDYVIENNVTLQVKTDDFFPYGDGDHTIWSGYFTSRATSKRYERIANNILQATKQLAALAGLPHESHESLEDAMGVMQHHDAITGTEKTHVEKDYHRRLSLGIARSLESDNEALSALTGMNLELKTCPLANVTICPESEKDEFNVLLYNPLGRKISRYIQIPVTGSDWSVTDPNLDKVEVAITEAIANFDYIGAVEGKNTQPNVLTFRAVDLPPLGYKLYTFKKGSNSQKIESIPMKGEGWQIGFEKNYVRFNGETGLVEQIAINGEVMDVTQELMYYKSANESGAYIFRPLEEDREAHKFTDTVTNTLLINEGEVVREVKQVWNDWAQQIVRIYKEEDFIEFEFLSGPIDVSDDQGKEIISRWKTPLATNGEFYTDSNGREMIYRRRNYRPTYEYTDKEPQAGNYYPVNARIRIKDETREFSVLTDRSQGGSSLNDGELELMINRGLLHDDSRGVSENLYEMEYERGLVVRGSHYVTLGVSAKDNGQKTTAAIERDIAQRTLLQPLVFFTPHFPEKSKSFLTRELPENVHLLTLDIWDETLGTVLIRLEHILEKDEDSNLSTNVIVDLTDLFATFNIESMEEVLIAANKPLADMLNRLKWPQLSEEYPEDSPLSVENRLKREPSDLKITLAPMQIRTFVAKIHYN